VILQGFLSSALHEIGEENELGSGRHRVGRNERNPSHWGARAKVAGDQDPARIAVDRQKENRNQLPKQGTSPKSQTEPKKMKLLLAKI
jgi:hypothetical protein